MPARGAALQPRFQRARRRSPAHRLVFSLTRVLVEEKTRNACWGAAVLAACVLAALAVGLGSASAARHTPPGKKIWHGVSDTGTVHHYRRFNKQVGAHTPLLQEFFHWGVPLTTGAFQRWERTDTRGVLSLSTAPGGEPEVTTPRRLAKGHEDHYMLRLNESIDNFDQVTYIRPFAEMNLHLNPYSAFNADGSRRKGHATKWFKKAWRRLVLIVRGGKRAAINRKLTGMGMPRIHRARSNNAPVYETRDVPEKLDHPKVAFMWMPLTRGSPNVPGNTPRDYWPGRRYVDWVGTDVYAKFSNHTLWSYLRRFFRDFRGYPFAIGEYAAWDNDFDGRFVRRIHRWARHRGRVRALLYFRSVDPDNEFNLQHYPGARRALRSILNRPRYAKFAPGTRDRTDANGGNGGGGGGGVHP